MELTFADKKFRDLCLNESLAIQALGPPLAEKLKRRLADLVAVSFVADLFALPGQPRELIDNRPSHIVMDLINGQQLIFQSGHVKTPLLQSGAVDWSRVRRVQIIGLESSHD